MLGKSLCLTLLAFNFRTDNRTQTKDTSYKLKSPLPSTLVQFKEKMMSKFDTIHGQNSQLSENSTEQDFGSHTSLELSKLSLDELSKIKGGRYTNSIMGWFRDY